jgi:hypothetical protein
VHGFWTASTGAGAAAVLKTGFRCAGAELLTAPQWNQY